MRNLNKTKLMQHNVQAEDGEMEMQLESPRGTGVAAAGPGT
jgi:hypothetical protein